jgi:hypothetical protein
LGRVGAGLVDAMTLKRQANTGTPATLDGAVRRVMEWYSTCRVLAREAAVNGAEVGRNTETLPENSAGDAPSLPSVTGDGVGAEAETKDALDIQTGTGGDKWYLCMFISFKLPCATSYPLAVEC